MLHMPTGCRTIYNPDESGAVPIHDSDSTDEVHAIDVDDTLRCDGEPSMEDCVQLILSRCKSGKEKRLRYIIYEQRIWESDNGWRQEYYGGSNPHDAHAHFSGSYESKHESDTGPWGLVEEYAMALTDGDKDWIRSTVNGLLADYVGDVVDRWTAQGSRVPADDPNPQQTVPSALYYGGADGAHMRYVQLVELQDAVDAVQSSVADLAARVGETGPTPG